MGWGGRGASACPRGPLPTGSLRWRPCRAYGRHGGGRGECRQFDLGSSSALSAAALRGARNRAVLLGSRVRPPWRFNDVGAGECPLPAAESTPHSASARHASACRRECVRTRVRHGHGSPWPPRGWRAPAMQVASAPGWVGLRVRPWPSRPSCRQIRWGTGAPALAA